MRLLSAPLVQSDSRVRKCQLYGQSWSTCSFFFFNSSTTTEIYTSFPTRRSSDLGESIAEGTLSRWLKQVGDEVKRDEPIFEISKIDRKSTRLNSSHVESSYAVFCLKKKR